MCSACSTFVYSQVRTIAGKDLFFTKEPVCSICEHLGEKCSVHKKIPPTKENESGGIGINDGQYPSPLPDINSLLDKNVFCDTKTSLMSTNKTKVYC